MLMLAASSLAVSAGAHAQVADLVTAFDAGSRTLAFGGTDHMTGADTLASVYNPAGLGYLSQRQIGLTVRNFPQSKTVVTGDLVPSGAERLSSKRTEDP